MMRETAKRYLDAGLCALPAMRKQKRPAVGSWKDYQNKLPDEDTFDKWFKRKHDAVCVLTGKSSGNLELIDFDQGGELFGPWSDKIPLELLDRLVIETSQSGGRHVVYRCENAINNSMKLARRAGDDGGPITLIETRGNGGLFLCAPTAGYEPVQGELTNLPLLTAKEHELLLQAAWDFNEYPTSSANCSKISDDVGQTGELSADNGGLCEDNSNNGNCSSENAHGANISLLERAKLYLDACDPAISGQGGHSQTFKTAQALVNGFCLEPDVALQLLQKHYNPRCGPPWSERELIHKVYSALKNPSDKPRGWLRDEGLEAQEGLAKVDISGIVKEAQQSASIVAVSDEQSSGKILVPKPKLWQPFPIDVLPGPVQRLCLEGAASMNSDTSVFALPALVCAASAIGNQFRVSLKESWNEPAILWGTIIGDSGDKKSPALQQVVQPIQDRQTAAFAEAAAAKLENPNAPDAERCLVSDVTVEALAARLEKAPYGLLVFVDELAGWFKGMGQYKSGGSNDVQSWLCFYDGRTMTIDRKTGQRTIHIPRASVCVCGGIQRKTMTTVMTSDNLDTGLIARLLMAMPPKHHDRWTEDSLSRETAVKWNEAITQLFLLRREQGATGNLTSPIVTLDTSAKAVWIEFYNRRAEAMEQEICDALRSAYRKLEGGAARLALVVHSLRWASGEFGPERLFQLDVDSMLAGIALSDWFLVEADRVYNAMLHDNKATEFDDLTNWIRGRGGSITAFELSRLKKSKFPTTTNAKKVLDRLVNEGRGTWSKSGSSKRGRPTEVFCIA